MAHIPKQELKKDEFRETIEHGWQAMLDHQTVTTAILVVVIVAALGVLGWRLYSERQDVKSAAAYDTAMTAYNAQVIAAGSPAPAAGETTFPDDKSKYTDAAAKFAVVASQYPRTHDGQLAEYYGALACEKIGKDDDAKRLLQQLISSGDADYGAMASYELAQIDERTGQGDAAAKIYQQLIDKPSVLVPKPVAMLALAEHYSSSDPTQAAKLYGQIKTDYPGTAIADQADQGLSMLSGKS